MSKEDISIANIIYNISKEDIKIKNINIFGSEFVKNNKNLCKMKIDNKEYEITEKYNIENNTNNELKIILKGINNVTNMSYMFSGCSSVSSLPDISKWSTNNVTNMSYMFDGCLSLSSLPDISKWSINNVTNMSHIFNECSSLLFYLIFLNGILIILLIWIICFVDVYHYHLYLIFLNGILIILLI